MFRGVIAKLKDQNSAGLQQPRGLRNQRRVEFRPDLAAEEGGVRLMLADFARQGCRLPAPDVRRIARNEIERR